MKFKAGRDLGDQWDIVNVQSAEHVITLSASDSGILATDSADFLWENRAETGLGWVLVAFEY